MNLSRLLSNISADILNKNVSHLLLDEATAEIIHWQTTQIHVDILPHISNQPQNLKIHILEELLSGKSQRIRESPSTDEAAVFLLSSPLLQSTLISLNSHILEFSASIIVCQNTALYKQMNESLINTTANVDIFQINCSNIKIAQDIHLIPAYNTQPAIRSDIYYWQTTESMIGGKTEPNNISVPYKLELQVLSEHILCLCSELGVTPDVFSIGSTSRVLAKNIITVIREDEPGEFGKKASLILIDRTLDMATVLSHCGDNLLDRVCGCFPDWCDNSSDVRINMSRMFSENNTTPNYVPGCLSQPNNVIAQNLIKSLATLRPQEVLLELVASLLDGLKKMGHKSPLPQRLGRITSAHISALLEAYSKLDIEDTARYAGELQIAEACLGCLEGGERSREWDTMQSREKLLNLVLTQDTDTQTVKLQLKEIVDNSNNFLQLLTTLLYVLLSSSEMVVREVEDIMREEVVNKIGEEGENFLESLSDELKRIARNKASLRLWIDDILIKFKDLCQLQWSPLKFSSHTTSRSSAVREPLIRDILSTILLSNAKIEELEYHPISFGEGLMSSLGYYMGKAQSFERKPSSNNVVIVFMLGGVTGKEIKCLTDICGALNKKNHRIVICSTRLSTPARMVSNIIDPMHSC